MDESERGRQAWAEIVREQELRALRFGSPVERQQKRAERWLHDPRKRKLEPRSHDTLSQTPPAALEEYLLPFARIFGRRDTVRQALLYLLGLLSSLGRKNGETMEAGVPGVVQESVYNFLARSPWNAGDLDRLRVLDAHQRTGSGGAPVQIILDECGWSKKGPHSVGVARQYIGRLGKVDNGQVIVSLHLTWDDFDVPGTAELYMPHQKWGGDDPAAKARRQQAGVPADWTPRTKPELAAVLVERVRGWGLPISRVHGDSVYGELDSLRDFMDQGLDVAFGIRANDSLRLDQEAWLPSVPDPPYAGHGRPRAGQAPRPVLHTPEELRGSLAATAWKTVAYRQDCGGQPLAAEFVALRGHVVRKGKLRPTEPWPADAESVTLWVVLQRPCGTGPENRADLKQYVISGPADMTLDELAQVAHHRPLVERNSYENAKQEVGLDHYQGRSWNGLHHHLAMVWLALTWLMLLRRPLPPTPPAFSQSTAGTPDTCSDAAPAPLDAKPASIPEANAPSASSDPTPPSGPASPPDAASASSLAELRIASLASSPRLLPRQTWDSVQAVRRCVGEWFAGMRMREFLFATLSLQAWRDLLRRGTLPPLSAIGPLPTTGT